MAIPELVDALGAGASVAGVGAVPAAKSALEAFWRRDVTRNIMREVRATLLQQRPAPGDSKSLDDIYKSLCSQLVNPAFLESIEALLEGRAESLPQIRDHLQRHLSVPPAGNRVEIITLVVDSLTRNVGRAQRDVKAAIDVAVGLGAERMLAEMRDVKQSLGAVGWVAETADGICVGEVENRLVGAITQDDGTVTIRCAVTAEAIARFPRVASDASAAIAVNRVGASGVLIVVDAAGRLTCHPVAGDVRGEKLPTFQFDIDGVPNILDVQRSVNRALIMVASGTGQVEIRHWPTGNLAHSHDALPVVGARALGLIWNRGAPVIIVSEQDGVLRMYDVMSGECCGRPWPMKGFRIFALATSTFQRRPILFTGDAQGGVRMWDMRDRTRVGGPFKGQTGTICSIFLGHWKSRRVVAAASMDGRIAVWDLASRTALT